jgi:adenosylcobinamide-phosphate synthase
MVTVLREYAVNFWTVGAVPLGVGLELALGFSSRKPSPAPAIERLIEIAERGLRAAVARQGRNPKAELLAGSVLAVLIVGLVGGLAWLAVDVLGHLGGASTLIGQTFLIAWGLSFGRLGGEVIRASEAPDKAAARRAVSRFVGLEATRLDEAGIRRACLRNLGERTNSLVVAPLFWLALLGPAGLWSYLAIDTLGAQVVKVGPRNRFFGFTAARLDDLANFVPARLTWLLLALSAALLGEDAGAAFRCGMAVGRHHPARSEVWGRASLDGALGRQPGGPLFDEPVDAPTVRRAVLIMQVAGFHAVALAIAYRIVVVGG